MSNNWKKKPNPTLVDFVNANSHLYEGLTTGQVLYPNMRSGNDAPGAFLKEVPDPQVQYYERVLGRPLTGLEKLHPSTLQTDSGGKPIESYWSWLKRNQNQQSQPMQGGDKDPVQHLVQYHDPTKPAPQPRTMEKRWSDPVAEAVPLNAGQSVRGAQPTPAEGLARAIAVAGRAGGLNFESSLSKPVHQAAQGAIAAHAQTSPQNLRPAWPAPFSGNPPNKVNTPTAPELSAAYEKGKLQREWLQESAKAYAGDEQAKFRMMELYSQIQSKDKEIKDYNSSLSNSLIPDVVETIPRHLETTLPDTAFAAGTGGLIGLASMASGLPGKVGGGFAGMGYAAHNAAQGTVRTYEESRNQLYAELHTLRDENGEQLMQDEDMKVVAEVGAMQAAADKGFTDALFAASSPYLKQIMPTKVLQVGGPTLLKKILASQNKEDRQRTVDFCKSYLNALNHDQSDSQRMRGFR